jgi:hypothetical protein
LRAIRLHSSANFRYVSDSPIICRFASQFAVRISFTLIQYHRTYRNQPRRRRVPIIANGSRGGPMPEDEYRHYAVECLLLAREMRHSAHKAVLLTMADVCAHVALGTKTASEGEEPV